MRLLTTCELFFMDLYMDIGIVRPKLERVAFSQLCEQQRDWLERPFSLEEVKVVL